MFVVDLIFALVVAALLTSLFYLGRSGRAGRWAIFCPFVIGALFAVWQSGIGFDPADADGSADHWFSMVFVVLLVAMLAAVLMPRRAHRPPEEAEAEPVTSARSQRDMFAVTLFFSLSALLFVSLITMRFV